MEAAFAKSLYSSIAEYRTMRWWGGGGLGGGASELLQYFQDFQSCQRAEKHAYLPFFPLAKEERRIGRFILEGTHLSFLKGTVSRDGLTKKRFRPA